MINLLKNQNSVCGFTIIGLLLVLSGFAVGQEPASFSVERKIIGAATKSGEKNYCEFRVTEKLTELYSFKIQLDYDIPFPALKVFNSGASILINSFDGTLTFLDKNGDKKFKTKISKEIGAKYERTIQAVVDEDRLVITLSQPGMANSKVQFYDPEGNLINEWAVEKSFINGLQYFKKKDLLALSGYKWQNEALIKSTYFYNSEGKILAETDKNFSKGRFINEGALFSGHTNKNYFLYDIDNEKLISEFHPEEEEIIIASESVNESILIVTTQKPFLEEGKWYYQDPTFKRFTTSGKIIKSWQEKNHLFSTFELEKNRNKLLFKTEDNVISIE